MYTVTITYLDGTQTRAGTSRTRRGARQLATTLISDSIHEVRIEHMVWSWRNDWVDAIRADTPHG